MKSIISNGNGSTRQPLARSVSLVVLATALMLLAPLVAMQFTTEVNWTLFDFMVMGVLLLGTGLAFVIAMRTLNTARSRLAAGIALALVLVLAWMELAVGIFGTPFAGS